MTEENNKALVILTLIYVVAVIGFMVIEVMR